MRGNREMLRLATGYDGRTPRARWRTDLERAIGRVPRVASDAIKRCAIGQAPWPLLLLGEEGAGKTCAALCVLDRYGGEYRTATEWSERLADARFGRLQSASGYPLSLSEVRNEWLGANLGVLDEIGYRANPSDAEAETLLWAIDRRVGRPLILISNRSLREIAAMYGGPVASRMGAGTIVTLTGDQRSVNE